MWGSYNVNNNDIMPHQLYVVGMECKPNDIMWTWLASHVNPNDVMMGMHNVHTHMVNVPNMLLVFESASMHTI